jgi:O-methyltransferase
LNIKKTIKLKIFVRSILNSIFGIFGIDAYFGWKNDKYDRVLFDQNTMISFFSSNERVQLYYEGMKKTNMVFADNIYKKLRYYTYQQVLETILAKEIDGDIVECGVWKGHSAYIWAKLLSKNNFKGEFHVFDSFEKSHSEHQTMDTNMLFPYNKKEIANIKEMFISTEEEVKKNLAEFKFIKYYDGWFPERFHEVSNRSFSFVHIDCDLYQPILDSLSFFFPRLSKGGCIAIGQYGITQYPGGKKAVDQFLSNENFTMFIEIPSSGALLFK